MCELNKRFTAADVGARIKIVNAVGFNTYTGDSPYRNGDVMVVKRVYSYGTVAASHAGVGGDANTDEFLLWRGEFEVIE